MKRPLAKVARTYAVVDECAVERRARMSWETAKRKMDAILELLVVLTCMLRMVERGTF